MSSRQKMNDSAIFSQTVSSVQALHEIAGSIHVDMKPQQLLIDETGRVMVNDFNSAHIMSVARDGTLCPVQSAKRRRPTPWPAPENYDGKVREEVLEILEHIFRFRFTQPTHPPSV